MAKHRTAHQLESRRNLKRLKRAHRCNVSGMSLKAWARWQSKFAMSEERRALCTAWLARKGLSS
jgi:hypothetical protein